MRETYVFAIQKRVWFFWKKTDILMSDSPDNPTLPKGWTKVRRIGRLSSDVVAGIERFSRLGASLNSLGGAI